MITSGASISSIKELLTSADKAIKLCSTIVPEIDPHRTAFAALPGLSLVCASRWSGLSFVLAVICNDSGTGKPILP